MNSGDNLQSSLLEHLHKTSKTILRKKDNSKKNKQLISQVSQFTNDVYLKNGILNEQE